MCLEGISDTELLEELTARVKRGKIQVSHVYLYDLQQLEARFESADFRVSFDCYHDVREKLRHRQIYETFYQPLLDQQAEKKLDRELANYQKKLI